MSWTRRVLRRGEGQLWFAGLLLWAIVIAEIVIAWLASPPAGRAMTYGVLAEVFTGRESGIPIALAAGVPRLIVFQISATQDIGSALLVYPLFLLAIHRWHEADNYFMRRLRNIEEIASRHSQYVHRWGPLGIAAFMLVPFLVNGPMVGLVLGRLAGIYTRHTLPAVIGATIIAAAAWTFAFDAMIRLGETVDPRAGWIIAGITVAIVLALAAIDYLRDARRQRAA